MVRKLAADVAATGRRSRLGPRSNLVLTNEQDQRVKALVAATAKLMGEPMAPTQVLRSAVSIGLTTLEQRFGLASSAEVESESEHHAGSQRRRVNAPTRG